MHFLMGHSDLGPEILFLDEELVVVEGKVIFKPGISRFLQAIPPANESSK
jgi:hypothetical protein